MDTVDRIRANAAAIKQIAENIDASQTEPVKVRDLKEGDIITSLGHITFPFPFTLKTVKKIGTYGYALTATHGWFTPGVVKATDTATRVI